MSNLGADEASRTGLCFERRAIKNALAVMRYVVVVFEGYWEMRQVEAEMGCPS